jgi:putative hemolysin
MNLPRTVDYIPNVCTALPVLYGDHWCKNLLRRAVHRLTGLHSSAGILAKADTTWDGQRNRFQEILTHSSVTLESEGRLPKEGSALVVANHPTGPMDGIVLAAWLTTQRSDVRILTTEALTEIPSLRDIVIPLRLYEGENVENANAQSLRKAMVHLRRGGILAVFPAGTIAVPHEPYAAPIEQPWKESVFALAKRCAAPVVCLQIQQQHRPIIARILRLHAWVRTLAMGWLFLLMRHKTFRLRVKRIIASDQSLDAARICANAREAVFR